MTGQIPPRPPGVRSARARAARSASRRACSSAMRRSVWARCLSSSRITSGQGRRPSRCTSRIVLISFRERPSALGLADEAQEVQVLGAVGAVPEALPSGGVMSPVGLVGAYGLRGEPGQAISRCSGSGNWRAGPTSGSRRWTSSCRTRRARKPSRPSGTRRSRRPGRPGGRDSTSANKIRTALGSLGAAEDAGRVWGWAELADNPAFARLY